MGLVILCILEQYLVHIRRGILKHGYSVMQSDGNSFYGDVFLDSFNKTSWEEDKISDQIYKNKYIRIIIMVVLILYNIIRKSILIQ